MTGLLTGYQIDPAHSLSIALQWQTLFYTMYESGDGGIGGEIKWEGHLLDDCHELTRMRIVLTICYHSDQGLKMASGR